LVGLSPSVLLVQGTAAGKSTVMTTTLTITQGVALIIAPLLALGADQSSKIKLASQSGGTIIAFHLDEYKSTILQASVVEVVDNVVHDSNAL
jgi:superfamily II DNA helicase RecQ